MQHAPGIPGLWYLFGVKMLTTPQPGDSSSATSLGTVTSDDPAVLDSLVTYSVTGITASEKQDDNLDVPKPNAPVITPASNSPVPGMTTAPRQDKPKATAAAGSVAQLPRVGAEMQEPTAVAKQPETTVASPKPSAPAKSPQDPKVNKLPFSVQLVRLTQQQIDKHTKWPEKMTQNLISKSGKIAKTEHCSRTNCLTNQTDTKG